MASIPRANNVAHLPGINPSDYKCDEVEKPKTFKEAIRFLRNKKLCKVTEKWNEDVNILIMVLKASDDDQDSEFKRVVELKTPGDYESSADEILESAQALWAQRHVVVMGLSLLDLIEG